ncbi:hypothetical protein [Vibrio phage JSF13]|jgi:hypothetical protein|uniref:Uncharacterized protein ORF61 n=1 Tax=Vibrio phage ICP1 TaxID=979525 RepID=F1D183_9CAUD|nr:hypothetical protein ViPhICP1_gp061 [Vibrio phage ICP1]ADX88104.1 hypothetical protein TUST1-191_00290 [Vibrio phage ICP1_2006_D]ADX88331.1 hypothetical protein TUST1-182_00290 [Vibrio phage ICP1_2006_C]ADX88558.1 hypothetical protein TUST1-159_00290 [Vibrio phage ICP1_2006_B]ADX88784.1 hypothetical protein TUST1-17_00290 [Vibrio phage ICP1_2006_A]ADX89010.1 hypothetical protein TUST1-15_00290 [Vibrio phage ICP1_2005_A]ADX89242.1 hypothetical protein TUST1-2_00300 [Vibrio phage ICP1_2001_A
MCKLNDLIGKTFVITDPDFEGYNGTIVDAFHHFDDEDIIDNDDLVWVNVDGGCFRGTFNLEEGYILEDEEN